MHIYPYAVPVRVGRENEVPNLIMILEYLFCFLNSNHSFSGFISSLLKISTVTATVAHTKRRRSALSKTMLNRVIHSFSYMDLNFRDPFFRQDTSNLVIKYQSCPLDTTFFQKQKTILAISLLTCTMQFMKQVEPKFCNPRRPMVVCGLMRRRLRRRRSARASLVFGNHGMNGTLIPNDLTMTNTK